ncbi:hypothetical protein CPC08DRAFT_824576 [Agrocybe pediades]|nr:hypothetical protein CPC08DRAFT_824576 [Agrocybe pediades]
MAAEFKEYCHPQASAAYSVEQFASITFEQTINLQFPRILDPGSIASWIFSSESPSSTLILPQESVPSIKDIQPIIGALEDEFRNGTHSVYLTSSENSVQKTSLFHFSKIRLFVNVNNQLERFQRAKGVAHAVVENNLLPPQLLLRFLHFRISTRISGIKVSSFPLAELGCLLHEEWIEEDIANALLELQYFRLAATTPSPSTAPYILLPTLFFANVAIVYNSDDHALSSGLIALKRRIQLAGPFSGISVLVCQSNHYTVYHFDKKKVIYGDSLKHPPSSDVKSILQSSCGQPIPASIHLGTISKQGSASGSCGIAALNFIGRYTEGEVLEWSDSKSHLFRMKALQDLLLYHLSAEGTAVYSSDWVERIPGTEMTEERTPLDVGNINFDDFNLYMPTEHHPIHEFLQLRASVTQAIVLKRISSTNLKKSESFAPSHAGRINMRSLDSIPSIVLDEPTQEHYIPNIPLKPSTTPQKMKSGASIIDLSHSSPALPLTPLKKEKDILDLTLVNSPPRHHAPKAVQASKISNSTHSQSHGQSIDVITISSSPSPEVKEEEPSYQSLHPDLHLGTEYASFEAAQSDIYHREEALGHVWHIGQSKPDENNCDVIIKYTLRCNHSRQHRPSHLKHIDLVNGRGNPWVNFLDPHPYPQTLTRETRGFFAKKEP